MLSRPLLQNKLLKSVFSDYNFTFSGEKGKCGGKKEKPKKGRHVGLRHWPPAITFAYISTGYLKT